MFRKIVLAAFLLLVASPALAGTVIMGGQWGVDAGLSGGSGIAACSNPSALPYEQCVQVPGRIIGYTGTITVKHANVELLANILCGGGGQANGNWERLWQGEMFDGTLNLVSPTYIPSEMTGPCWLTWQALSPIALPDGAAWEMNVIIYYQ